MLHWQVHCIQTLFYKLFTSLDICQCISNCRLTSLDNSVHSSNLPLHILHQYELGNVRLVQHNFYNILEYHLLHPSTPKIRPFPSKLSHYQSQNACHIKETRPSTKSLCTQIDMLDPNPQNNACCISCLNSAIYILVLCMVWVDMHTPYICLCNITTAESVDTLVLTS